MMNNVSATNNFVVIEGGRSVREIMRKSRIAAARRRKFKKIRIAVMIMALIVAFSYIIFSNIAQAKEQQTADNRVKGYMYIRIAADDTLWGIASTYSDEHYDSIYQYIREVKELNGLTSDSIYEGSRLIIPIYASRN